MTETLRLYYDSIRYWWPRIKGKCSRPRFIATKMVEVTSYLLNKGDTTVPNANAPHTVPPAMKIGNGINDNPSVAIVVPVYVKNQTAATKLHNLIESIAQQTYTRITAIFVDDQSPFQYTVPDHIQLVVQPSNQGPAAARNRGIEEALRQQADIIAFTDSDCVLHPEWVSGIFQGFRQDEHVHVISGNTISRNRYWLGHYHDINGTLNGRRFKDADGLMYGATCNLAVVKNVVEHIRFDQVFPTAAGEDVEFCFRILKKGFKISFSENVIVYHDYGYTGKLKEDLPIFWKQFARHAAAENKVLQLIPGFYSMLNSSEEIAAV